jgi:hypothetical protein
MNERFKDDEVLQAIEIQVGAFIRELVTGVTKMEKAFPDCKITAYWVGDVIRIDIK